MDATVEKYLPWIVGGGVIIGGIVLFKSGAGATSGYDTQVIPSADTSQAQQAQIALAQQNIAARAGGFSLIVDTFNNELAARTGLESQRVQTQYDNNIAKLNDATERARISAARHASNNSLISGVVGTIVTAAILSCYEATALNENNRIPYLNGGR